MEKWLYVMFIERGKSYNKMTRRRSLSADENSALYHFNIDAVLQFEAAFENRLAEHWQVTLDR